MLPDKLTRTHPRAAFILLHHSGGELARLFAADADTELVELLQKKQAHIGSLFEVEICFFGVLLAVKTAAIREEVLQESLVTRIQVFLLGHALAIDAAKIAGAATGLVGTAASGPENETGNGEGNDNGP